MRRLIAPALLACVLCYAALLRVDALVKTYGPYERPAWLASIQPAVRTAAAAVTPDWPPEHDFPPYVGADPANYLIFAREMRHFYAAHVREPGFPAATRVGLILTGNEDVGISLTSIAFALLAIAATYLLGRQIASPAVGLAAAAALAVERAAVGQSIEGWRDEMFACFAVLSAWAWLRVAQQSTPGRAVAAGLAGGGALVTRITSLSLLAVPVVLLLSRRAVPRPPLRHVAAAVAISAALIAPFLINCAIETGDPLYAINNHTDFYLKREGIADPPPTAATAYVLDKFRRPLAALDTVVVGMIAYPFSIKWAGFDQWYPGIGRALSWFSVAGLVAWMWHRDGRLLLLMLLGALVPFSATWTVRGGGEWRLTLFAYSFYLIAAFWFLEHLARWRVRALLPQRPVWALASAAAAALAIAGWVFAMPYLVTREALANHEPVLIRAGERDGLLLSEGWSSELVVTGNVTSRFATSEVATITMPLPEKRAYQLLLRMDPLHYDGAAPQEIDVALNGQPITTLTLGWNPQRIGEYSLRLPASAVVEGANELEFHTDAIVAVGRAGRAFPELPRDRRVGPRFWYVLVVPS